MPKALFPRTLVQPPVGRPYWKNLSAPDLNHLGWGRRFYGPEPVPVTLHPGWVYVVVLRGTPTLELADKGMKLSAGAAFILHPDCASGWSDHPEGVTEILSWFWKQTPSSDIAPAKGGLRLGDAMEAQLTRLQRLHKECRREVQLADTHTWAALSGLYAQLESEFARIFAPRTPRSEESFRFELAMRWLESNLARRGAIAMLREYLDVSRTALHSLFVNRAGCSPAEYFQRRRMQKAKELVNHDGLSAKAAAFRLGYAHANDLSRAFHRHVGRCLTDFRAVHNSK